MGTDCNTMSAPDAEFFRSLHRRRSRRSVLHFQDAHRTFLHADTVTLALLSVDRKKSHIKPPKFCCSSHRQATEAWVRQKKFLPILLQAHGNSIHIDCGGHPP